MNAELDTASPYTIISLDTLLKAFAEPKETPQDCCARVNQMMESPTMELLGCGKGKLNILGKIPVDITYIQRKVPAKVYVHDGAPFDFLIGNDLLLELGFVLVHCESDDLAAKCSRGQVVSGVPVGRVKKLSTATRLPARCTKVMEAHMNGIRLSSTTLLEQRERGNPAIIRW